jgi:hypothetical protein
MVSNIVTGTVLVVTDVVDDDDDDNVVTVSVSSFNVNRTSNPV